MRQAFCAQTGCPQACRLDLILILEFAMRKWVHAVGQAGIDLMDEGTNWLDLPFADYILIFTHLRGELG